MDLNEETLAGQQDPALVAGLKEEIASREWWDQWSTDFLFTWLWDFNSKRPPSLLLSDAPNRDLILTSLVKGQYARPKEDNEETQFRLAWCTVNGIKGKKQLKAKYPSLRHTPAASADAAATIRASSGGSPPPPPRDAPEEKKQGGGPRQVRSPSPAAVEAVPAPMSPPPARLPSPALPVQRGGGPDVSSGDDSDVEEEEVAEKEFAQSHSFRRVPLPPAAILLPSGGPPKGDPRPQESRIPIPRRCKTCLKPPEDPKALEWICECGLRGDKEAEAACNVVLAAMNARKSVGSSASSSSASAPSAGQSYAQGSAAKGLERELLHLAKGPPHPLFTGSDAEAPLTGGEAIAIVRKALGASATENPSKELRALVDSGLLINVGYCIPRSLAKLKAKSSSLMLMDGAEIPIQASSTGPPPVPTVQAYMRALVTVILPVLIAKPAALTQWLALTNTALEIEEKQGWPKAFMYIEQLLQERVAAQEGFAEPSQACMATLFYSPAASTVPASQSSGRQSGGAKRADTLYCDAYNWENGGCTNAHCTKLHQCQYAARGCTNVTAHRSPVCPSRYAEGSAPRHNGGSQRSGGGRGRGGGGGSRGGRSVAGGSSVATTPKA